MNGTSQENANHTEARRDGPARSWRSRPSGDAPRPARRLADLVVYAGDRWGAAALRITLGLIMIGFGALKFFPGVSPAEPLAIKAVTMLSLGLVTGKAALIATAVVEVGIGLMLVAGVLRKLAVVLLVGCIAGWMSPLVLFPGDLFAATGPSLEAQYLIKDIVFVAGALVVAAGAFRRVNR